MAASGLPRSYQVSPMNYVEETLDESTEYIEKKKKVLLEEQSIKAPFLVGSIAEVNRKVSKLDRKLQSYTALVVESRNSDKSEKSVDYNYFMHEQDENLSKDYERRLKEIQEVNQFAGIYAIKSTFLTKPSERAKNISQISMQPNKTQYKKDVGKPKFVELHQFPGYDGDELTELPHLVRPKHIFDKVVNAHPKLQKTPLYRPEFERLFYSQMSQAILQDTFWFIFLEKWGPNSRAQQGLFNRVSHNYVKLLLYTKELQYRETFLKDYPSLLAQAVYAAYCEAFPDSYRQFDERFKEDLVNLIFEWVIGLRPAPRTWLKWNMKKLEPANIKMREELLSHSKNKKSNTASLLDFSSLDQPQSHISGSISTLNPVASVSSISSNVVKRHKKSKGAGYKRHSMVKKASPASVHNIAHDLDTKSLESGVESLRGEESGRRTGVNTTKAKTLAEQVKEDDERKDLTPIREFGEDKKSATIGKLGSFNDRNKYSVRESHSIGRGAEFSRGAFNTYGKSPLVAQYLRMQNLSSECGMSVRVQRTEIDSLPPLESKTYAELTHDSYKSLKAKQQLYHKRCRRETKERQQFIRKQKAVLNDYMRKESALLCQKREVKRLSDLIMLELRKDPDSVSANAMQAVEQALLSQDG